MKTKKSLSSQVYAAMPKRIQYLISQSKKQIRRYSSDRKKIAAQVALNQRNLERLKGKRPLRVLFLAIYESMWKYDSVFRLMQSMPEFEPILLVCKAEHLAPAEQSLLQEKSMQHFSGKGYKPIRQGEETKASLSPDLVFYSSPYENQYSPELRQDGCPQALSCYALYGYPLEDYAQWYDELFHNRLWRYFLVSDYDYRSYCQLSRSKGRNGFVSGAPQIDAFIEGKKQMSPDTDELPLVILAPHHSIEAWGYSLSNFLDYHQQFVEAAEKYKGRLRFAFKPHPVLKSKLYKLSDWGKERTDSYYRYWQEQEHCELAEGSYIELFLRSSALVHDCSAFTAEYQIVDKPSLFMRKNNRLPKGLNQAAQEAFILHELADSWAEVDRFLERIASGAPDSKASKRKAFQKRHLLAPNGISAASAIVDEILKQCS